MNLIYYTWDNHKRGYSISQKNPCKKKNNHEKLFDKDVESIKRIISSLYLFNKNTINLKDENGSTYLHYAVQKQLFDVVQLLKILGANIDILNYYGITPLGIASQCSSFKIFKYLLENGADPDNIDKSGSTPLHNACFQQNCQMIDLLLAHGARSKEDKYEKRPIEYLCLHLQKHYQDKMPND